MDTELNIAMIASECVPFAKTGGLADVVGSLPQALARLAHNVIVILPKYRSINSRGLQAELFFQQMGVWMGDRQEWCAVHRVFHEGIPVFLIEFDHYFDRDGLYHDSSLNDFADNPRRFSFFSRAALQLCIDARFAADIVHVHDWQTALAAAYLNVWHWDDPMLKDAAAVLTIHNIGYQGVYGAEHYDYIGLGWQHFSAESFEDHGRVNFLKGGIYFADLVNTVSPTYARETRTPEYAHGMAPYLNNKGEHYVGILNGVDYQQWNPESDSLIPANFTADDLGGKAVCKEALQRRFLLQPDPTIPVIGVVSRFADQKGLNVLAQAIEGIAQQMQVQFVILGSGDKDLEAFYQELPARYPGRIGSYIGYHNELAHWIEAGSDFFIMPSTYEPCGLNQIYSLKYGTLPIVRATGGLDDTVEQYDESDGSGTGFKFWDLTPGAIFDTVGWAVSTYYDRPEHMRQMIQQAMQRDFSWDASAQQYVAAYQQAIKQRKFR